MADPLQETIGGGDGRRARFQGDPSRRHMGHDRRVDQSVGDAEQGFAVWKYDAADGSVTRQTVQVGAPRAQGIEVLAGLSPGELIVATGASHLQPGMRVSALGEPSS